jgi:hypothetical protein
VLEALKKIRAALSGFQTGEFTGLSNELSFRVLRLSASAEETNLTNFSAI